MKLCFIFVICGILAITSSDSVAKEHVMLPKAQKLISEFRNGKIFVPDESVKELMHGQRVDPASLRLLAKELAVGPPEVRENIVQVLEYLGLQLDQPANNKLKVIRDHEIIKTLLTAGFTKNDPAYHLSATIVADRCLPADLAKYSEIYLNSLQEGRSDYLFIIAKAKINAANLLEKMADAPKFQTDNERTNALRIARAALGNKIIEEHFISDVYAAERDASPAPKNRFYDTSNELDGGKVAEKLYNLGLIGTKRSLSVACKFLRSPMKTYVPNHRERSIRYYALDAIRYNYPDEKILLKPITHSDWVNAEQFCTDNIGVTFESPTPEFPRDRPYPVR